MRSFFLQSVVASIVVAAGASAASAGNVIPTHTDSLLVAGTHGVLRAGSPWGPGSTPSSVLAPIDGLFRPEHTQWNNGSFWWDEDPSVNALPVTYEVQLDSVFTFNRFVIQADDNDSYRLEYLDASSGEWVIPAVFSFGLVTRDSGYIAPVTTDRLRISAISGDNYYSVSEIQAFVPEPAAWAMMIFGFGLAGAAIRSRRDRLAAAAC